jgi:endoglucanase
MSVPSRLATLALCVVATTSACAEGTLTPDDLRRASEVEPGAGGQAGSTDRQRESAGTDGADDTESAGEAGANGRGAVPLVPNEDGEVTRDDNSLGIQGAWTTDAGTDSSLKLTVDGSKLCMTGTTAMIPTLEDQTWDFENYWGARASMDLCHAGPDDDDPDQVYTLGTCPWSPALEKQMVGVRFTVEGDLPAGLLVQFREEGQDSAAYVTVTQTGEVVVLFKDAVRFGDSTPVDPTKVESVGLYFFPSPREERAFDVCISKLEALTGRGWTAVTIPDWALEPGPGKQVEYAGVNLAGAEFGEQNLPGVYGTDYTYPEPGEVDVYADIGMNIIRLPFRWERLQQSLGGELDATELGRIDQFLTTAKRRDMTVILDPHNFARYDDQVVGEDLDTAYFADFWSRLAKHFVDDEAVIFGLMNEPHDMSTEVWLDAANEAIAAIRKTGAKQLILVPGNAWTGAHSWTASYYGTPNSEVMGGVRDPGDNFAYELHQYLDADSSGSGTTCPSTTIGVERLTAVTEWLSTGNYRGFLGEFGAPANDTCLRAMDELLTYVGEHSDIWMGWAVWAGGPWWGENILSVEPRPNGDERPQMAVLERHLTAP